MFMKDQIDDGRKASISGVPMLRVVLVGGMLACASLLLGKQTSKPLTNVTVTVTPMNGDRLSG